MTSDIEDEEFHFIDVSDATIVRFGDSPSMVKGASFLKKEKFIKIINPEVKVLGEQKSLVLTKNSKIIPSAKIKTLSDDGYRTEPVREDPSFENIQKLEPNDVSKLFKSFAFLFSRSSIPVFF